VKWMGHVQNRAHQARPQPTKLTKLNVQNARQNTQL